jgi:hypothetical protein
MLDASCRTGHIVLGYSIDESIDVEGLYLLLVVIYRIVYYSRDMDHIVL